MADQIVSADIRLNGPAGSDFVNQRVSNGGNARHKLGWHDLLWNHFWGKVWNRALDDLLQQFGDLGVFRAERSQSSDTQHPCPNASLAILQRRDDNAASPSSDESLSLNNWTITAQAAQHQLCLFTMANPL